MLKIFRFDLTLEEMIDVFNALDSFLQHLDDCLLGRCELKGSRRSAELSRDRVSALYQKLLCDQTGTKSRIRRFLGSWKRQKDIT
jgi:hypothetical protein